MSSYSYDTSEVITDIMNILIFISLFSNLIMVGISLITHFVTYPSFKLIKSSIFSEFHKSYTNKMLLIVAPVMILELISSILLVIFSEYVDIYYAW